MARQAAKRSAQRPAKKAGKRAGGATGRAAGKNAARRPAKKAARRSGQRGGRSAGKQKDLGDLFMETLKDIYHAEKQILRALPKMAKAAQSGELRQAFQTHTEQTRGQVARLEKIFEMSGQRPKAKTCHAIMGLVEEGDEVMKEFKGSDALDAGLLAAAQAVEHYEISRYGTMKSWAAQHGMQDVAGLLDETLAEEKETDELLTRIAESVVNRAAT